MGAIHWIRLSRTKPEARAPMAPAAKIGLEVTR